MDPPGPLIETVQTPGLSCKAITTLVISSRFEV